MRMRMGDELSYYLHCSSIGYSLIRVDGPVEFLSSEEVLKKLLDLGDPSRSSNQDDVVDGRFVNLGVLHGFLDRLEGALEKVDTELLELGPGDGGVEIDSIEHRVDLDISLRRGRKSPLGPLASSPQPPEGPLVSGHVLLVLPLELVQEVIHHPVVEVLATQMGVASGGLDFEDSIDDVEDRDIEGATAEVEDEDIGLSSLLFVESVGDGGGCGLVDDPEQNGE